MEKIQTQHNRRSFLKVSAAAGGGMILGFSWLAGCKPEQLEILKDIPNEWFDINAFLKIGDTGLVTIMSPNPEIGQNVKTSMPMIVAEELDVDWKDVVVEQAGLNSDVFTRQVAGGSQSIRQGWESLRRAGATARKMLVQAAADSWGVDPSTCSVYNGIITNQEGLTLAYGDVALAASQLEVPENVELKDVSTFNIIGKSKKNVDMDDIISGKPLFGIDTKKEGMAYSCAIRPPSFGQELVDFDDSKARSVNGIQDIFAFGNKVAILADNTWAALKAQKLVTANWKAVQQLESSEYHETTLDTYLEKISETPRREDGDVFAAIKEADEVFERRYGAPFLPHSCMEPMNFFADVQEDSVYMLGPIQTPAWTRSRLATLLERPESDIKIDMTRMGGGFGRRLYGDFALEAAEISKISKKPVQHIFSRQDDMTAGTYRPASKYKFTVAIKAGKVSAYHLTEACFNGMMFDPMPNNYPAGTIENFRIDSHNIESNITTGAWRAPYANFLAFAEQAFIDELAQHLGKDPVDFRLELFDNARNNPVGENNNYEIDKYVGVINLAKEKSSWGNAKEGVFQGFCAYFSHNTYVAEVADVVLKNGMPQIVRITCAVDCGIVINPIAAQNQIEGGIIDGIGHAMYGNMQFSNGRAKQQNFDQYRLIRIDEVPAIDIFFVESLNDPTGLGEPTLPPAGGAIANALTAATGKRLYHQPFVQQLELMG